MKPSLTFFLIGMGLAGVVIGPFVRADDALVLTAGLILIAGMLGRIAKALEKLNKKNSNDRQKIQ